MLDFFAAIAKDFTAEEKERLYSETALEAYRMNLAAGDGLRKKE